jgi:hypothetical protein
VSHVAGPEFDRGPLGWHPLNSGRSSGQPEPVLGARDDCGLDIEHSTRVLAAAPPGFHVLRRVKLRRVDAVDSDRTRGSSQLELEVASSQARRQLQVAEIRHIGCLSDNGTFNLNGWNGPRCHWHCAQCTPPAKGSLCSSFAASKEAAASGFEVAASAPLFKLPCDVVNLRVPSGAPKTPLKATWPLEAAT